MSDLYQLKTLRSVSQSGPINESTEFLVKPTPTRGRAYSGWRFGVVSCACSAFFVFTINLSGTIWAIRTAGQEDGRGTLFAGSCTKVRELNVGVHLLINVLSTILLSASNYCMQCLSAPTRVEVDKAHAKRKWLDIGVPSIKNLRHISGKRVLLWWLLGFTSLPLHLFYNSAVFSSIAANSYTILEVNEGFVSGGAELQSDNSNNYTSPLVQSIHKKVKSGHFVRLSNIDCIDTYARPFITSYGNVLLVLKDSNTTIGTLTTSTDNSIAGPDNFSMCGDTYEWICYSSSDCCDAIIGNVKASADTWAPFGQTIDHCMAETVEEHCKLQFSFHIAGLVIILNLAKTIIMCLAVLGVRESPLMTVGDAISSYLQQPDVYTEGMCMVSKQELVSNATRWNPGPRNFSKIVKRWSSAASKRRWITCLTMYGLAIGLVAGLMGFGISQMLGQKDFLTLARLGIGAITPSTFINGWSIPSAGVGGLIGNVLVANAAQPVLSFLYFTINGLFTCMLAASEWSLLATKRKGLRVSASPIGSQRTSYTLQLPYKYALPLMILSGLLHWLVSQSIFLVSVESYDFGDDDALNHETDGDYMTCGYSPSAMVLVIVTGVTLVLGVIFIGRRKFTSTIPVAGSCSAAIAAACQPGRVLDEDAAFQRVQWGVMEYRPDGVGHCGFSSHQVEVPEDCRMYAGACDTRQQTS